MAKVAIIVERAMQNDPNTQREKLEKILSALPTPMLQMFLNFSTNQIEKFGKPVQFV